MEAFATFAVLLIYEFIFWSVLYLTGSLILSVVTLSKVRAHPLSRDSKTNKRATPQTGMRLIKQDNRLYLGALGVIFIGLGFWSIIITLIVWLW